MKWVLIFIMFGGGTSNGQPPTVTTHRFESLVACQETVKIVNEAIRTHEPNRGSRSPTSDARCILDTKDGM